MTCCHISCCPISCLPAYLSFFVCPFLSVCSFDCYIYCHPMSLLLACPVYPHSSIFFCCFVYYLLCLVLSAILSIVSVVCLLLCLSCLQPPFIHLSSSSSVVLFCSA